MTGIGYNKDVVKNINESLIRKTISGRESFTKSKIAAETELSFPTVSRIVDTMVASGELMVDGIDESTGGRHAMSYRVNPAYAYILGFYLMRPNLAVVIVMNAIGEIVERQTTVFTPSEEVISKAIDEIIAEKMRNYPVRGIACGLSCGVSANGELLFGAEKVGLKDFPLKEMVEKRYGIPIRIENDLNTVATGCYHRMFGGKEAATLACASFNEHGAGMGLYVRGHLVRGANGFAGELRYAPLVGGDSLRERYETDSAVDGAAQYIGQLMAAVSVIVDPAAVVLYDTELTHGKEAEIKAAYRKYIPDEIRPELIMSDTYQDDYEQGLVKYGMDMLQRGYRIVNR